jgi:anti-sigma regulatory factor (Ser/Thr protein kinase)
MEVMERRRILLEDASQTGEARRIAGGVAMRLGCDEVETGRIALVVTEAATNIVKHAGRGEILLDASRSDDHWRVRMVAIDRGPGMRDVAAHLQDGMSTTGTAGTGLGAIRRIASAFDVHTAPTGTVVFAEIRDDARARDVVESGIVCVPLAGEEVCGDDCALHLGDDARCTVLTVDGLGHGPAAATAAREATRLFRTRPGLRPEAVLQLLHDGLRGTRGAAAAVAEVDWRRRIVRFAGIGNVAGSIQTAGRSQSMVSHHGTLGHTLHRVREFTYPLPVGSLVILHSDGLSARWDLRTYPGLQGRHATVMAAALYRDFARPTDDASIVVVREAAAA